MKIADFCRKTFVLSASALSLAVADVSARQLPVHHFEVGDKTFLLDGKPFVVKAAEVHYSRIPRPYWEHRIRMCKALGMNTLCIYIFWNLHEQEEGKFDFSGDKDIAEFCRLAQKHGMYVIVRPGPYVCAEWEMGGLPWWLLKKSDIRLRERDPYFMERVGIFEKEVARQLKPLTLSQGGPILMVQVENEYGSYGEDKAYVGEVRDLLRKVGFDDVLLFQCDWSSNFTKNGLDDLLWTMNFGTGANVQDQFKRLRELRPTAPLMCSEYWSGWFDGWGRGHETRKASAMVAGLREMLDNHISFSLYMTHGGTSFGHWAGANSPGFKPDCTSYDYDAPIDETGCATEKYHELRAMLSEYNDDEGLPEIPAPMPQITIPAVTFTEAAPLFDNLPKPVTMAAAKGYDDSFPAGASILPMEYFGQGFGSILYSVDLPAFSGAASLKLEDVHDYARIFIDRKLAGTLYRGNNEQSLMLPAHPEGGRLEILVEGMGRINFGRAIKDYKGITDRVTLTTHTEAGNDSVAELRGWDIALLPSDYAFAKKKKYKAFDAAVPVSDDPYRKAGYYRATFHLNATGDTHLDMRTWGKGFVWVNGHNLGRFWEVGPQQTLFVPGCWLKKGRNEIIVLDIIGPAKAEVSGLEKPINNMLRVQRPAVHRAKGDTLRLDSTAVLMDGEFAPGNGWQEVAFPRSVRARYLCLEALDNHEGSSAAAMAECYVLGADGKRLSREPWRIFYADSEDTQDGNNTADKVFDLQESTYWNTRKNVAFPHHIVIDLGAVTTISAFQYLPRMEVKAPGAIRRYRIYTSETPFVK